MNLGTLYVVATPIGNLEDITLRALRLLQAVSVIAAEDTRVTAKLLAHHGIDTPMMSIRGEKTKPHVEKLVSRLEAGDDVALVTDAGTPSVSDPGYDLVTAAHDAGVKVSPLPGPSALAAAVSAAGLKGEGVRFLGFLPRSGRRRKELLSSIRTERAMVVIYESPRRAAETLTALADTCGERNGAVLRELTKIHEEVVRGPLSTLRDRFVEGRGEFTIAVEGLGEADEPDLTEADLTAMIAQELGRGRTVKDVAASLSSGFGLQRKKVYKMALEIQQQGR